MGHRKSLSPTWRQKSASILLSNSSKKALQLDDERWLESHACRTRLLKSVLAAAVGGQQVVS